MDLGHLKQIISGTQCLGVKVLIIISVNFFCQIAIPRNTTQPTLSVRFKESNTWGGWSGITASSLKGSATINANKWIRSNDGSGQIIYFGSDARTYYLGYHNLFGPLIISGLVEGSLVHCTVNHILPHCTETAA
jgi:hypothetical protein